MPRPMISQHPSVGGHSDYSRDRHDPPALAHLEIGGVKPDIGTFPSQRAVEELAGPLVDVLAQLRYGGAGPLRLLRQARGRGGVGAAGLPGLWDAGAGGCAEIAQRWGPPSPISRCIRLLLRRAQMPNGVTTSRNANPHLFEHRGSRQVDQLVEPCPATRAGRRTLCGGPGKCAPGGSQAGRAGRFRSPWRLHAIGRASRAIIRLRGRLSISPSLKAYRQRACRRGSVIAEPDSPGLGASRVS